MTMPLSNGGCEGTYKAVSGTGLSGSIADGWRDDTAYSPQSIRIFSMSTDTHEGLCAQSVELRTDHGAAQLRHDLDWTPTEDREYTVSLWLKGKSATDEPMRLEIGLQHTSPMYAMYLSRIVRVTDHWTRYTFSGMAGGAPVALILRTNVRGTFLVDNAKITSAPATIPGLPAAPVQRNAIGMHVNKADIPGVLMEHMGVRRLWDTYAGGWASAEPARGVYDWTKLDSTVAEAQKHGIELIYTFGITPPWASARPSEHSVYGDGNIAEPANVEDLRAFASALSSRYRGRIRAYEIWNEANEPTFFSGTPEKLVEMAQAVYEGVKSGDPHALVLSANITGQGSAGYLDYYLSLGGDRYADIISAHVYANVNSSAPEPEASRFTIYNIRKVIAKYPRVRNKPIWDTEQNWQNDTSAWGKEGMAPDDVAAAYIARSLILNWRYGYVRIIIDGWDYFSYFGIYLSVHGDANKPSAAGQAYISAHDWMTGNRMTSEGYSGSATWFELTRPNGKKTYVVWNAAGQDKFAIPSTWAIDRRQDLDGATAVIGKERNISIGPRPILLLP